MADSVLPAAWRRVQKGQKRRGTGSVCAGDPGKREAFQHGVAGIASVDVKADEVGILALAKQLAVPFLTYPAGRLQGVDGTFTSSGFVAQQVGVDNVCERAAVCAAGEGGRLLVQKTACEGKTLAIAEKKWSVKF